MLQSASKPLAVAEHNTKLPQIAAEGKVDCTFHPEKPSEEQRLPHIADKSGKRMERSTTPSDLRVVVYDTLELKRACKIGVKPLRNFDVTRSKRTGAKSGQYSLPPISSSNPSPVAPQLLPLQTNLSEANLHRSNTLAPFTTLAQKSTCGFYFNRDTLNKKVRIGVPPSDLVKWRTDYSLFPQPQKQA